MSKEAQLFVHPGFYKLEYSYYGSPEKEAYLKAVAEAAIQSRDDSYLFFSGASGDGSKPPEDTLAELFSRDHRIPTIPDYGWLDLYAQREASGLLGFYEGFRVHGCYLEACVGGFIDQAQRKWLRGKNMSLGRVLSLDSQGIQSGVTEILSDPRDVLVDSLGNSLTTLVDEITVIYGLTIRA